MELLNNLRDADLHNGRPVFQYDHILSWLPAYQGNRQQLLTNLLAIIDSDGYKAHLIGLPANFADASIIFKDTFRCQAKVPQNSYLVMVCGMGVESSGKFASSSSYRMQMYDTGAGMYLYSWHVSSLLAAGNMVDNQPNFGPFILPSPLIVTKPGQLAISMCNNDPGKRTIQAQMALFLAVPKTC